MSDELKPCPVCGGSDLSEHTYYSPSLTNCDSCNFRCRHSDWQKLLRTRWVSVEERLPESGDTLVRYEWKDGYVQLTHGHAYTEPDGKRYLTCGINGGKITHWLDDVPALPPAQQETR